MESFISRLRKEKLIFLQVSKTLFGDLYLRSGGTNAVPPVGFTAWPHVLQACMMEDQAAGRGWGEPPRGHAIAELHNGEVPWPCAPLKVFSLCSPISPRSSAPLPSLRSSVSHLTPLLFSHYCIPTVTLMTLPPKSPTVILWWFLMGR